MTYKKLHALHNIMCCVAEVNGLSIFGGTCQIIMLNNYCTNIISYTIFVGIFFFSRNSLFDSTQ